MAVAFEEEFGETLKVKKLSDMVCHLITRREDLTVGAIRHLPHKFTAKLLKFAVEDLSYPSLKLLMPNLRDDLFSLNQIGVSSDEKLNLNRIGTAVIRAFFESLEERISLHIKTIDVTGFPLSGAGLAFLAIHGILAHSEAQRAKVLQVVERAKQLGRISGEDAESFGDLSLQTTIAPGAYTVLFDCHLSDTSMANHLAEALKVSQWADQHKLGPSVSLGIQKIHFSSIDLPHVLTVMELIEPEYVQGVKLSSCYKGEMEEEQEGVLVAVNAWVALAQVLERFSNLNSLELNALGLSLEEGNEEEMATRRLLSHLPKLNRLSLWMSRISRGRLRHLLQSCRSALSYLNLRACNLSPLDLMYLSQASVHTSNLREVDLSENSVVADEITTTCCLLKACRRTLQVVLLAFCRLQTHHLDRLVPNLVVASRLKLVDLRFNAFDNAEAVCAAVGTIAAHQTLDTLMISPPVIFMAFEEREQLEAEFVANVERIVREKKAPERLKQVAVIC